MRKRGKSTIPVSMVLLVMSVICILILFLSYTTPLLQGPVSTVASYIFMPFEKSLNYTGQLIFDNASNAKTNAQLQEENEELKAQVESLQNQLIDLQLEQNRLNELEDLYDLDQSLGSYETTAANVVSKSTSNWYNTFTIDKGSSDGIEVDMNVLSGNGLCGIVISVSNNYSVVRTIIDDSSKVSAMILTTEDNCILSGSTESMNTSNTILLSNLKDSGQTISVGDTVVTSNISDKYLPGLLIGYVASLDPNDSELTRTGTVTPVVDFIHINEVLVIKQLKGTSD